MIVKTTTVVNKHVVHAEPLVYFYSFYNRKRPGVLSPKTNVRVVYVCNRSTENRPKPPRNSSVKTARTVFNSVSGRRVVVPDQVDRYKQNVRFLRVERRSGGPSAIPGARRSPAVGRDVGFETGRATQPSTVGPERRDPNGRRDGHRQRTVGRHAAGTDQVAVGIGL